MRLILRLELKINAKFDLRQSDLKQFKTIKLFFDVLTRFFD